MLYLPRNPFQAAVDGGVRRRWPLPLGQGSSATDRPRPPCLPSFAAPAPSLPPAHTLLNHLLHTISKADRAGQNPFASVSACEEGEGWRAAAAAGVAALVLAEGPGPERQRRQPSIMAPFHSSPAGESVARRAVGDRTGRPRCVSLATRPPSPAGLRLRLVWRGGNEQNDPSLRVPCSVVSRDI